MNTNIVYILKAFLAFFLFPIGGYSQITINCGGVNQVIPVFKDSPKNSFQPQVLVKRKILQPIWESKSTFEIRIYAEDHGMASPTTIIKCTGDSLSITQYDVEYKTLDDTTNYLPPEYQNLGLRNIGPLPKGAKPYNMLLKITTLKKPVQIASWDGYFRDLIANHFYDLPDSSELDHIIHQKHPGIENAFHHGNWYVEMKAGNHCRHFFWGEQYNPQPIDVKEYQYLINISKSIFIF